MEIEFRDVVCQGDNTIFLVNADGMKYLFTFANKSVHDYLQETEKPIDCSQYVLECQELFEEIAKDMITKDPARRDHLIDNETIKRYFNCLERKASPRAGGEHGDRSEMKSLHFTYRRV